MTDREASVISVVRNLAVLKLPLVIAAGLTALWWLDRRDFRVRSALLTLAGVALGWGFTVHIVEDAAMAHRVRTARLAETRAFEHALPDNSALFAYWGNKDAIGPVLLSRDIVVVDVHADDARDAPQLVAELLAKGRRVFLFMNGFSGGLLDQMAEGLQTRPVPDASLPILELVPSR
jgi:hypothetical protein